MSPLNSEPLFRKRDRGTRHLYLAVVSVAVAGHEHNADGWSFRPALLCVATVALVKLFCQIPGSFSFFLIPISLLAYAAAALYIVVLSIQAFVKKRPRHSASTLLVMLSPILLWRPINWVADVTHIGLSAGLGIGQLGRTTPSADSGFAVYDWSVGLAGANTFLIHDVTKKIALPIAQHKQSPSSEQRFVEECAGKVDHVIGHYYICRF